MIDKDTENEQNDSIINVVSDCLYVFGESSIEIIPPDLSPNHPFSLEASNASR